MDYFPVSYSFIDEDRDTWKPDAEQNLFFVTDYGSGSESPSRHGSSDDEHPFYPSRRLPTELHPNYWQIQKIIKFMKGGNQTACIAALSCLLDFDMEMPSILMALVDVDGLELLVNLIEANDMTCVVGSLRILKEITKNLNIVVSTVNLGICTALVNLLKLNIVDVMTLASTTLSHVCTIRKGSRSVRKSGGIEILIGMLNVNIQTLLLPEKALTQEEKDDLEIARCAATAVRVLSKYTKNKHIMMKGGLMPLVAPILISGNTSMSVPITGILENCSTEPICQTAIESEGLIGCLVSHIMGNNTELQRLSARALERTAARSSIARSMILYHNGFKPLVSLLQNQESRRDKPLIAAVLNAIWRSAMNHENNVALEKLGVASLLVDLLSDEATDVKTAAAGALAECAHLDAVKQTVADSGGIQKLIGLLMRPDPQLLSNVARALGECSKIPAGIELIDAYDGVRLLWSLIKNKHRDVQVQALYAVKPCIKYVKDSGEVIRSLVGSLQMIASLLDSDDTEILSSTCSAIAEIANDRENLAVLTEQGVVRKLTRHATSKDLQLRTNLAEAVANCSGWGENASEFGRLGIISVLSEYLNESDKDLLQNTCLALYKLSYNTYNCVTMHYCKIIPFLFRAVESTDHYTQESAAKCLSNIRKLVFKLENRTMPF